MEFKGITVGTYISRKIKDKKSATPDIKITENKKLKTKTPETKASANNTKETVKPGSSAVIKIGFFLLSGFFSLTNRM